MRGNLFVLKGVSDFAPGAFENTAVEAGSIQLGSRGGEYLPCGSYTSPAIRPKPFTRLMPGWNADTPHGTTVEMQARVHVNGKWSRWLSFGTWSPFVYRHSLEGEADEIARIERDTLVLADENAVADIAQLRILLEAEDICQTPRVHLLAGTVDNEDKNGDEPAFCDRVLEIPAYSCLVRDPPIAGHIASSTTLTMLMNRWGQDALPEEVARAMYDTTLGLFGNMAFVAAAAGMYGYECYPRYCGLDAIRREVQHGCAVAAQVHYRAPMLGREADDSEKEPAGDGKDSLPVWEDAEVNSPAHLIVVRGFAHKDGRELVLVSDPYSETDAGVKKTMDAELFERMYTGLSFFLHKGPRGAGGHAPERKLTTLAFADGEAHLSAKGEVLQPGENIPGTSAKATICFTLSDGIAYASAAQKKFYYIIIGADGRIPFDTAIAAGHKLTFYLIGSKGTTWVAEKQMEDKKE